MQPRVCIFQIGREGWPDSQCLQGSVWTLQALHCTTSTTQLVWLDASFLVRAVEAKCMPGSNLFVVHPHLLPDAMYVASLAKKIAMFAEIAAGEKSMSVQVLYYVRT